MSIPAAKIRPPQSELSRLAGQHNFDVMRAIGAITNLQNLMNRYGIPLVNISTAHTVPKTAPLVQAIRASYQKKRQQKLQAAALQRLVDSQKGP